MRGRPVTHLRVGFHNNMIYEASKNKKINMETRKLIEFNGGFRIYNRIFLSISKMYWTVGWLRGLQ